MNRFGSQGSQVWEAGTRRCQRKMGKKQCSQAAAWVIMWTRLYAYLYAMEIGKGSGAEYIFACDKHKNDALEDARRSWGAIAVKVLHIEEGKVDLSGTGLRM